MIETTLIAPGITTCSRFVGAPGARVFTSRTGPADQQPELRLIVCPPIGAEAARNYRRETLLSRQLAGHGVETIRFHYRGSGHSEPSPDDGFQSMVDDARLVGSAPDDDVPMAWMGTRLGGSVATAVLADAPGVPLVIWDPVLDTTAYFREILRARVFSAFKTDDAAAAPKSDLIKDLQSSGSIDLLGYSINAALLDQIASRSSIQSFPVEGRSVLLLDLRRKGDPRSEVVKLVNEWRTRGADAAVTGVALYEPWWYGARSGASADDTSEANRRLLELTIEFVLGLVPR
jgi:pimeloyl-ACP methyl ester carboxylesterase